jgi:hypothetical protein
MDKDYLTDLRQQLPLREVLAKYHVRYYIATQYNNNKSSDSAGCFKAVEPYMAGPHCPHMRGVFCETPAAVFPDPHKSTVIFDLGGGSSVSSKGSERSDRGDLAAGAPGDAR